MAECELGGHGGYDKWGRAKVKTALYWVCPDCVNKYHSNVTAIHENVKLDHLIKATEKGTYKAELAKTRWNTKIFPVLGLLATLIIISEMLYYWH